MRILHVLHSLDQRYGGPVRAVLDLSERSLRCGLESEILGFGPLSLPDNSFPRHRIHSLPIDVPTSYCYSRQLSSWLRKNLNQFDGIVLHGMWLYPNWAVATVCWKLGKIYACFPHGMMEQWSVYKQGFLKSAKKVLYWNLREKKIFDRAHCVFFTTKKEMELTASHFQIQGMRQILVPYGVNVQQKDHAEPVNKALLQPTNRKAALFSGRVHPKKNIDFLLRPWAQADLEEPWHLLIAGPGDPEYVNDLRVLIRSLNLVDRVHLLGFVSGSDKSYLLQRADWFLLPSKQENFGIAVMEALSFGCPVAISDQVYISELFHSKAEVMPLEMSCWIKFLRERMTEDRWRNEMVEMDRRWFKDQFNVEKISAAWTATLQSVFCGPTVS